ncbi:hypothetical protein [uncultured Psychroserpens sp.]|uniref:hypothetical protein n=1 Tax=uncultured Psychroserpens sp. TaxID=255436 RepID=UPI00261FF7B3|nr:hypothetical protein [uncultured Psychroserpens sp.]
MLIGIHIKEDLSREYLLQGTWKSNTGSCKPGKIMARKPIKPNIKEEYNKNFNREIKIAKSIEVESNEIILQLWDNNKQDGDVITLYLNNKEILSEFTVKKKKKKLKINIDEGNNILIVHTINLGTEPPNTAAISISDGKNKKNLILKSDMSESAAVEIIKK